MEATIAESGNMRAMLAVGFCKPEHATLEQIADVFCACLRNTPPERHGGPAILLKYALKKAWRLVPPGK